MTDDGYFGADVAPTYDQEHGGTDPRQIAATVDLLHELAAGGACLEFAIGTGRIALPLAAKGCVVKGIELSQAMVDELRKKETGVSLEVSVGDMTTMKVTGEFSLVFLVFNTIDNLVTQDAQVACFENAARHLKPGGRFLIETLVPPLQGFPFGETRLAFSSDDNHLGVDEFDVAAQTYWSHHAWTRNGETKRVSVPFRYAWPAELDLMARLAGLKLEHRWSNWDKAPFDHLSKSHISVWRKPAS